MALPVGITLTGNMRGQLFGQCYSASRACRALSVRVFNGLGWKADLIRHFPTVLTSDFATSYKNRYFCPSETITGSYTTVAGDTLVVEAGSAWFTAASGPGVVALIRFGDASVIDLPVDEATIPSAPEQCGWLEFEGVNLYGSPDPYLMTLSGDISTRLAAPSMYGLHFYDRTSGVESIWDGATWKDMVAGLKANVGGSLVGGNIEFDDTNSVHVAQTAGVFTWTQQYAAPSGGYDTVATPGTPGTTSIASDAVFPFPEALGTLADRTARLDLIDLGTGAVLFPSGPWSDNYLDLRAPAGALGLIIDKNGFVGTAGNTPIGLMNTGSVLTFSKVFTTVASYIFYGVKGELGVGGTYGHANTKLYGGEFGVSYYSSVANVKEMTGLRAYVISANAAGTGNLIGVLGQAQTQGACTRSAVTMFKALPISGIQGTITSLRGFWYSHVSPSSVQDDVYGFDCSNINSGTNRYGVNVAGFTGGTPAVSYSFCAAQHSVGTVRRTLMGVNSSSLGGGDWITTANGYGLITKDAQGTPEYWRMRTGATGLKDATMEIDAYGFASYTRAASPTGTVTFTMEDVGTTAPAT